VIDAVEMGPSLGDARVVRLPPPVDDIVSDYLELAHLEAPGLIQGLYLVGSVALADFRPRTSDIDFVAVTGPPPEGPALRALARVHGELRARWPRPSFDGLYVTWDDLKLDPSHVGPRPRSHEGHFEADSRSTPDPVTWCTLARYGVACLGPTPSDLEIWTDDLSLATWSVSNLDDYWRPWRARASRLISQFGLFSTTPYATVWGVTGVSRLHYTLATGDICSKEAAGRYALATFPDRWRRVVREALRIRRSDYAGPSIGSGIAAQGRDFVSLWKADEDRSLFWSPLERRRDLLAFIDMVIPAGRRLYERRLASGGYGDR
jgi:hypothetical protein